MPSIPPTGENVITEHIKEQTEMSIAPATAFTCYTPRAFLLVGLAALLHTTAALAEADFSGVWMGVPNGGLMRGDTSSMSAAGKEAVAAYEELYGDADSEIGKFCVMNGMPSVMFPGAGYPIEFLRTPGRLTLLAENENQVRRIYLDGREHPGPDDFPLTRLGHSVGHWEGDTLIVHTTLLREDLDWTPRSDQAEITERFYLVDASTVKLQGSDFTAGVETLGDDTVMVIELTMTDPKFYNKPINYTFYYQRLPDYVTLEYDCTGALWEEYLADHLAKKQAEAAK
ncbi:MAG: hypothetical protein H6978_02580 [Gammaproteobacteria bacterium]|nr:hypothetical protein [Gammaproteobacteria bacterium]